MNTGEMQLMVARETDSRLFHTIRFPDSWQPWGDVTAEIGPLAGVVYDVAAAQIGGDVHYLVSTNFGLFHTIRFQTLSWQRWGNVGAVPGLGLASPGDVFKVAAANVNDDLHVVVSLYTGDLLHTIRFTQNSSWQPWGDIKAAAGPPGPGQVVNVAAAGIGGDLHVVVVRHTIPDTDILHTVRFPTSWQPWGTVDYEAGPLSGFIWDIAAAAVEGNLHVVATNGNSVYHTIRFPTSWQEWGDVEGAVGELGSFWGVAAANVAGDLHLVPTARAGGGIETHLYHTIRFTQPPSWQLWGDIELQIGDPGDVRSFGVA